MLSINHATIKKILIIQWSAMGDCVIATSIFDDLRAAFPIAQIHLNTLPPWDNLFIHDSRIDKIIAYPMRKKGIKPVFHWLKEFNREQYDLVIDLQSNDRTKILLSIAKLLGMKKGVFISRRPFFCYDATLNKDKHLTHIFTQLKNLLATIEVSVTSQSPKLIASQSNYDKVNKQITELLPNQTFALFIPGCSPKAQEKRWPEEHYISLAKLFLERTVDRIIVIGTKDEDDVCIAIARSDDRILNLCNQTELLDLCIWCEKATVIIGNDTGSSHIAASTTTPQITLFGPTVPEQSKPFGQNILIISAKEYPSSPNSHPMQGIPPDKVFDKYVFLSKNR